MNASFRFRSVPVVLVALVTCIAFAQTPPPRTQTFELGRNSEIRRWLVLGYLPGVTPADQDRDSAAGPEADWRPFGGQEHRLGPEEDAPTLTWKPLEPRPFPVVYFHAPFDGLELFVDSNRVALANATAYLYCEILADEAREVRLRLSGGEPIRVWFNGTPLDLSGRNQWRYHDRVSLPLSLAAGANRLLIRMSNTRDDETLLARLGGPLAGIRTQLRLLPDVEDFVAPRLRPKPWEDVIAEIPPVPPSEDAALFGANLGRTLTLLETGGQTRRPVRILFYGQSITASEWVWLLVARLRERYPGTEIQAENWAISGWGIDKLNRTIKHDILRARPDLVVLHAYQGGSWEWERIIQKIRRETTAEIMIRTAHIAGGDLRGYDERGMSILWRDGKWVTREVPFDEAKEALIPEVNSETLLLRRLARTYGCELVECRKEWLNFMRTHGWMDRLDLCSDGLHLNRKGAVLMAQLYERHFTIHSAMRPWFETVRRYEAMRPLADRRNDEVRLLGDGWNDRDVNSVTSTGTNDVLSLRFVGNRIDLVMPQHNGRARILINGKPPSEWNLLHGTRPESRGNVPYWLMTYYMGENMLEESWELTFTHLSGDFKKYRFTLTGSKTGPDGEGDQSAVFVSNSGRITIKPFPYDDFLPNWNRKDADAAKTELEPVTEDLAFAWSVRRLYGDEVVGIPQRKGEPWKPRYDHPYRYATIIDGLPPGEHELTLVPLPPAPGRGPFAIESVDVHRPPLWGW